MTTTRKVTHLQSLKGGMKSYYDSNDRFLPHGLDDMKKVKRHNMAITFADQYLRGVVDSKTEWCKINHISRNTLNKALKDAGMMHESRHGGTEIHGNTTDDLPNTSVDQLTTGIGQMSTSNKLKNTGVLRKNIVVPRKNTTSKHRTIVTTTGGNLHNNISNNSNNIPNNPIYKNNITGDIITTEHPDFEAMMLGGLLTLTE